MAPASSMASNSTQSLITLVFGITATAISIITIWQGHKFWKLWSKSRSGQDVKEAYLSRTEHGFGATLSPHSETTNNIDGVIPPLVNGIRPPPIERFELHTLQSAPTMPAEAGLPLAPSHDIREESTALGTAAEGIDTLSAVDSPDVENSTVTTNIGSRPREALATGCLYS